MLYVLLKFCEAFFNGQKTLQTICLWVLKNPKWQYVSFLFKPVLSAAEASPEQVWWFASGGGTFSQLSPRHSPGSRAQRPGPVAKDFHRIFDQILFSELKSIRKWKSSGNYILYLCTWTLFCIRILIERSVLSTGAFSWWSMFAALCMIWHRRFYPRSRFV